MKGIKVDKLSKLLTAGKKLFKRQEKGYVFTQDKDGNLCGCAIGAIAVGAGYDPIDKRTGLIKDTAMNKAYDIVQSILSKCDYPIGKNAIYMRNDAGESFSGIAKYLRRVERESKISCK